MSQPVRNADELPAVGTPVERPVGRPVDEATDAEGPRGTYGCACVSRDPRSCLVYRSDHLPSLGEQCECMCHGWSDDDDYLG